MVEWHLKLNGWTGEKETPREFYENPTPTPPHLNPFLCPRFYPMVTHSAPYLT